MHTLHHEQRTYNSVWQLNGREFRRICKNMHTQEKLFNSKVSKVHSNIEAQFLVWFVCNHLPHNCFFGIFVRHIDHLCLVYLMQLLNCWDALLVPELRDQPVSSPAL